MSRFFRSALFPLIVIAAIVWLATQTLVTTGKKSTKTTFSAVIQQAKSDPASMKEVVFNPSKREITVYAPDGTKQTVHYPSDQAQVQFQDTLQRNKIVFDSKGTGSSPWWSILTSLLPFVLLFGFWIFLMNQVQGGGSKVMSFGKSRAKRMAPDSPKTTFKDVAGADEAVEELQEIKEFLENPKKFQALGARIPKGVLLYGPPGTGKTLLARAVAGEAGVPFFSISGSDFVEMFVGVGASRVRDLFEQAKQSSPCIIFMDEIDAVGRHRGAGLGGGHDEREQTLNQLLVEMDGFEMKDNIILIAATNRPDILDPALLRPGRFDRQIVVDRPDRVGRRKILEVHSKGKPLAPEIDLDSLAAGTPGFTGADLANLVNEAALLAARWGKKVIEQSELEEGIMRVIAGPEKKARLLSEKERKITAYHEMGHAIVGHYLEGTNPIHKITIVSRGQALGLTVSLPLEDRYLTTKSALMDEMAMTLGGRAAEEIVFHEITTGAANDLEKVTATAKAMIMRYGMSEKLGPRVLGRNHDMPFLGRDMGNEPDYSDEIAREIDDEIRRVIEESHEAAHRVLQEHIDGSAPDLGRADRARDDRRRPVRAAARGRVGAGGLPGRAGGDAAPGARRGEEARPGAEVPSVPAPGRDDAGPGPRALRLTPRPPIELRFPRPSVMGILNVTPDSFSDGGVHFGDPDAAAASARAMVEAGAAIVDLGGESTRPGADGVPLDEELRRVVPVLERLEGVPVSIDTAKAEVARQALALGAEMVNDVTALRGDPELAGVVADSGAYLCLMHMLGEPRTMQRRPDLRRRRRRGRGLPRGAPAPRRSPRACPRSGSASTRESASARRSSTTSSCCAGSTSSRRSAGRSSSASRARARSGGCSATRARRAARSRPASARP